MKYENSRILKVYATLGAFMGCIIAHSSKLALAEEIKLISKKDFAQSTLTRTPIRSIVGDKRGIIYFAQGANVLEFDGISWHSIPIGNITEVLSLDVSTQGRVYVGGYKDIGYLTPDTDGNIGFVSLAKTVPEQLKPCLASVFMTRAFPGGVAYVCEGGAMILDANEHIKFLPTDKQFTAAASWHGKLLLVDSAKGLMSLSFTGDKPTLTPVAGGNVIRAKSITPLNEEELIINTLGNGVIIFKNTIKTEEKTPTWDPLGNGSADFRDHNVSAVLPWINGYVIATFLDGVYFVDKKNGIVAHTNDQEHTPGNDIYSLFVDRDNGVWAGTEKGLAFLKIDTGKPDSKDKSQAIPFSAIIREVVTTKDNVKIFGGAFFKKRGGTQELTQSELNFKGLPFSKNALRFSFSSNSLGDSKNLKYRTMLQGFESKWTDWSDRSFREFTNIIWNKYAFKVQVQNKDGIIGETSTYEFEILPPWYETWWFYLAQFALLLTLYLVAAYARGTGKPETITHKVNGIFISILFGLIYSKIGLQTFLGTISNGVGFIELAASAILGLALKPIETFLEKYLCKFKIGSPKPDAAAQIAPGDRFTH